jgi:hypothetical protein
MPSLNQDSAHAQRKNVRRDDVHCSIDGMSDRICIGGNESSACAGCGSVCSKQRIWHGKRSRGERK